MYEDQGSFKSLEDVQLKTTYNVEVNGRTFEAGETIAVFDKIQVSGLREFKEYVTAHGGFDNRDYVFWETTQKLQLTFSQGVFSNLEFGLLNNAKVIKVSQHEPILVSKIEELESNELGNIYPSEEPVDQIFIYEKALFKPAIKIPQIKAEMASIYVPFNIIVKDGGIKISPNAFK